MAAVYYTAVRHLRAGTITAKEKRLLLQVNKTRYYARIRAATVSG